MLHQRMKYIQAKMKAWLCVCLTICLCISTPVSGFALPTTVSPDTATDIIIVKSGNAYTIKSNFSSTQAININFATDGSANGGFCWQSAYLKTGSTSLQIANGWDDVTPIKISNQYVGGNHQYPGRWTVFCTGHNKTSADLGSVWNCGGNNFTLIAVGVTALYFAAPFVEKDGMVSVSDAIPKEPVTYVRGGSEGKNTSQIDITGDCTPSLLPHSLNNISVKCYTDGVEITKDGTFYCNVFQVKESYNIMAYDKILEYAETHAGVTNNDSIEGVAHIENTYTYSNGLNCTVKSKVTALRKFYCTLFGALQADCFITPGYVKRYMPNVKPKTAVNPNTSATKVFDFAAGVNLTDYRAFFPSESNGMYYNAADFNNPSIPPNHTVDWACDSGGIRQYGFTVGYVIDDSSTSNANRMVNCSSFWRMWATKKSYPHAVENTIFNPGDSKSFIGFRNYLSTEKVSDATLITSVKTDDALYLYIDYNNTVSNKRVRLDDYIGKPVSVVQSENFTLHNSAVDSNGVTFDITGNIGNAVLKIDLRKVVTAVAGSGCVVNRNSKLIYGLRPGVSSLDGFINVIQGYGVVYVPTLSGFGTGTTVNAVLNSVVAENYQIVIFGDVNGDGNIDPVDADTCMEVQNWRINWNHDTQGYFYAAGDVNGDGNVDAVDADIITELSNGRMIINQTTGLAT